MGRVITSYSRPKPKAGGLFFSPGVSPGLEAEVWATDGTLVQRVWNDPTGFYQVSHLAHATATGKLYLILTNFNPSIGNTFDNDVLQMDPTTFVTTHFAGPYQFADEVNASDKPATHAAEAGGYLYISNQGGHAPSYGAYVVRVNLSGGAVSLVAQATSFNQQDLGAGGFDPFFTGGLGLVGSTIYWNDGVAWWSGSGGSLSFGGYLSYQDPTFPTDYDGFGSTGSPVSYSSQIYYPGQWAGNETASPPSGYAFNAQIHRMVVDPVGSTIVDLGVLSDTNSPDKGGSEYNRMACCTVRYDVDDVTPLDVWALDDGFGGFSSPGPINTYVWKRSGGGSWTVDTDLQSLIPGCRGVPNGLKSFKGQMYAMVTISFPAYVYIVKRSLAGSWSILHTFAGYIPASSNGQEQMLPIARVSATIKCHEM